MKILIVYTNYGTGHTSAATALKEELSNKDKTLEVELLDILTYSRPVINFLFKKTGKLMATKFRNSRLKLYNKKMYKITKKSKFANFCTKLFWTKKLKNQINDFKPDLIVSTQVGPTYMLLKQKHKIGNPKIGTVFTDYGLHNWHLLGNNDIDYYFVPTKDIKKQMVDLSISEDKIYVTGVPISKDFKPTLNRKEEVTKQYSLEKHEALLLFVAGGGLGYGNSLPYFKELLNITLPFSYIFVAGKNEKLQKKAELMAKSSTKKGIVLGYTKEMATLLSASDLLIGKPGGLITTEAIQMNTPICAVEPIPGQELKNIDFIIGNNFGIYPQNITDFRNDIENILKNKDILQKMKICLEQYQIKNGSESIAKVLLKK